MYIYIPPFWAGVTMTLVVEFAMLLAWGLTRSKE